jgi:hypothetical protein
LVSVGSTTYNRETAMYEDEDRDARLWGEVRRIEGVALLQARHAIENEVRRTGFTKPVAALGLSLRGIFDERAINKADLRHVI